MPGVASGSGSTLDALHALSSPLELPAVSAAAPRPLTPEAKAALDRFRPQRSIRRRMAAPVVVAICKVIVQVLNRLETHNLEAFEHARAQGRALVTFSNHVSLFDDPWLVATFSGVNWDRIRWCATDALNFFGTPMKARFFSAGKGVPVVRGAGLNQLGMRFLEARLRDGDWVHIFPEGGRSRDPMHVRTPLKPGMAHLIRATRPLLLPFHHRGMENVLPIGDNFPRFGNQVSLRFGEVTDSDLGIADLSVEAIMTWAEEQLLALEAMACEG